VQRPTLALALVVTLPLFACARVGDNGGPVVASGGGGSNVGTGAGGHGATSGGTGSGGAPTFDEDGGNQCGLQSFDLVRKPADLFLLLDRSASMQNDNADKPSTGANDPSKWAQVQPAVMMAVTATDKDVSWGFKTFPEDGAECAAATLTSKIDVGVAPMNAAAVNAAVSATMPLGNGTPTAAAVNIAYNYLKNLNDNANRYILLATDGQPSCTAAPLSKNPTQAHTDAVAAVTAAAAGGIKTFVVGVATTSTTDAMTLNDMAVAGGEAQPNQNPLATKFYLSQSQTDLVNAIQAITGQISTCTFPLSSPPPVPEHIAVKVSGVKAPQDTMHLDGWDYTDGTFTAVQVYGPWCDMIKNSAANMVTIIFGCKDIIPT
jgi:hypothetical protein